MLNDYKILRALQLITNHLDNSIRAVRQFVKYVSGKDKYVLEVEVNDLRPVDGFL